MALAAHGHRTMKRAAHVSFKPLASSSKQALDVYFLTGHRYWHQTLFCARSLVEVAETPINFMIVDDGSLRSDERQHLYAGLGQAKIISITEEMLDQSLPRNRFPTLRARRETYGHLRKLTDIHSGQTGWKLVCDSDMLFFRKPKAMLDWLERPSKPCHLIDVENAYGYSPGLMAQLTGSQIAPCVNVGLCGLKSDDLDWDQIEYWCQRLIDDEGMKYLLEQALSAMLLSTKDRLSYDQKEYIVAPTRMQTRRQSGIMHHYTADSKEWYYRFGWKSTLTSAALRPYAAH